MGTRSDEVYECAGCAGEVSVVEAIWLPGRVRNIGAPYCGEECFIARYLADKRIDRLEARLAAAEEREKGLRTGMVALMDERGRKNPEGNSMMLWNSEWDALRAAALGAPREGGAPASYVGTKKDSALPLEVTVEGPPIPEDFQRALRAMFDLPDGTGAVGVVADGVAGSEIRVTLGSVPFNFYTEGSR